MRGGASDDSALEATRLLVVGAALEVEKVYVGRVAVVCRNGVQSACRIGDCQSGKW